MKIFSTTLFCFFLFFMCSGETMSPGAVSLSIEPLKNTYKADDDIRIGAVTKNISHKTVLLSYTGSLIDSPDIVGVSYIKYEGRQLGFREEYLHKHELPRARSLRFTELKPEEFIRDEVTLSAMYDMSRPGTYEVQMQRLLPRELGGGHLMSNMLTITVSK